MTLDDIHLDFCQINKFYLFSILCLIAIALSWFGNEILLTDDLFFEHFGEQLTYERIVNPF